MAYSCRQPRTIASTPWALWLLALLLALRSLIPAGYMPDLGALRDGRLAITICSTSTPDLATSPAQAYVGHYDFPDFTPNSADCPFGMLVHQTWLPGTHALQPLAVATPVVIVRSPRSTALPVQDAQGPPLGSRAPPPLLFIA